ncbi:MAG: dephospho-CoA kinase [Bacteroidota bacterium]
MSNKPLQVGITGGIGSGKSIVCKVFHLLGAPVYDADTRAKWLQSHNQTLINQIKHNFGEQSYLENGQLNRQYLADQVFNDKEKLKLINELVHPRVGEDYKAWRKKHADHPYLIKEAALMFESGSYHEMDKVITVVASDEIRLNRVLQRDLHRTSDAIREIMKKQLSEEEKIQRADYTIKNDNTEMVLPRILALHDEFKK